MKRLLLMPVFIVALSSCAPLVKPCAPDPASAVVYVVGEGWHTDIGIPVEQLDTHAAYYRKEFPGAQVIMFGYGKKTFMTAPPESISEYILGPVPGPALIQAVGLNVMPPQAYPDKQVVAVGLSAEQNRKLVEYVWTDLSKGSTGSPLIIGHSSNPAGVFYAAESGYSLFHTCNSWAADALQTAGLPLSGDSVVFSRQLMARVNKAAMEQCLR